MKLEKTQMGNSPRQAKTPNLPFNPDTAKPRFWVPSAALRPDNSASGIKSKTMRKTTVAISLLAVALVVSNAWWAYRLLDAGVSYTYQGVSLEENQQALSQALAIIKVLSENNASREQILQAAQKAWPSTEPFEKDGYLWVGRLGLRFNEADHLIEAVSDY